MNSEISPISDVRGTAQYKILLANQLVKAHFIKLFPDLIQFWTVLKIAYIYNLFVSAGNTIEAGEKQYWVVN